MQNRQKQLQAHGGVKKFGAILNKDALRSLRWLRKYMKEALGLNCSDSVIIRRALTMYFLHFVEVLYTANITAQR